MTVCAEPDFFQFPLIVQKPEYKGFENINENICSEELCQPDINHKQVINEANKTYLSPNKLQITEDCFPEIRTVLRNQYYEIQFEKQLQGFQIKELDELFPIENGLTMHDIVCKITEDIEGNYQTLFHSKKILFFYPLVIYLDIYISITNYENPICCLTILEDETTEDKKNHRPNAFHALNSLLSRRIQLVNQNLLRLQPLNYSKEGKTKIRKCYWNTFAGCLNYIVYLMHNHFTTSKYNEDSIILQFLEFIFNGKNVFHFENLLELSNNFEKKPIPNILFYLMFNTKQKDPNIQKRKVFFIMTCNDGIQDEFETQDTLKQKKEEELAKKNFKVEEFQDGKFNITKCIYTNNNTMNPQDGNVPSSGKTTETQTISDNEQGTVEETSIIIKDGKQEETTFTTGKDNKLQVTSRKGNIKSIKNYMYGWKVGRLTNYQEEEKQNTKYCLMKLYIPENAKVAIPTEEIKMRASEAFVAMIFAIDVVYKSSLKIDDPVSIESLNSEDECLQVNLIKNILPEKAYSVVVPHKDAISYTIGEEISINNFEEDLSKVCVPGIHFSPTIESALYWIGLKEITKDKINGYHFMNSWGNDDEKSKIH